MPIVNLGTDMPTRGFLKLGENSLPTSKLKGAPYRFDHVEITGRQRDKHNRLIPDKEMLKKVLEYEGVTTCGGCARSKELGFPDGLPVRVPIFLPYNGINNVIPNRLAWYRSGTAYCVGDGASVEQIAAGEGEGAQRLTVLNEAELKNGTTKIPEFGPAEPWSPCGDQCPQFKARQCKPNARMSLILAPQQSMGSVYQFKTTSWNSIRNIVNGLGGVQRQTGGVLQWVPLWFEVFAQTVSPKDGPTNTQMIASVDCPGDPVTALKELVGTLQERAPLLAEVRKLEAGITAEAHWVDTTAEEEAFQEEFYPDGQAAEDAPPPRDESLMDEEDIARLIEIAEARADGLRGHAEYDGITGGDLLAAFLAARGHSTPAEVPKAELPELLILLTKYEPEASDALDPFAGREGEEEPPVEEGEPQQHGFTDGGFENGS